MIIVDVVAVGVGTNMLYGSGHFRSTENMCRKQFMFHTPEPPIPHLLLTSYTNMVHLLQLMSLY